MEDASSPLADFVNAPARQASVTGETAHRPWPLPENEWIQAQTWDDLLFAHWRVPEEVLRPRIPESLTLQTYDGTAWLGITPFKVSNLRVRGLLPIPVVSSFLEINVRTYVERAGKTGIWFFSLDAASTVNVEAARRVYRLPYFKAEMSATRFGSQVAYSSARRDSRGHFARFEGSYEPTSGVSEPRVGTLEHFLTERYSLFTVHDGRLHWAQIHHPPWPLQEARAEIEQNTMPPLGIEVDGEPLCHFSKRQDVVIWPLEPFDE